MGSTAAIERGADDGADGRRVVFLEIAWRHDPRTNRLIVMSAEDNIVKGTSGQAIQCFNIMNNLPETTGLI